MSFCQSVSYSVMRRHNNILDHNQINLTLTTMYICTDRWTDGRMLPTCLQHSRQMSQIFFFPSFTFIFASQSTDDLTYLRHLEKLVTMLRQSSPKRQVVRFVRVVNGVCAVLPVRVNYPFTSDAIVE